MAGWWHRLQPVDGPNRADMPVGLSGEPSLTALGMGSGTALRLGGTCRDEPGMNLKEIDTAEKSGLWDRVVDLEKVLVRGGCRIPHRWYDLANALWTAKADNFGNKDACG
jgi:hypothetical protein